ncbi:MAG TPA: hypothetical protein VLF91_06445 [Candidatus Saccharimonadales bacterium]|nr:hypothetical protein [Candidatus Saccharimonadales bacterium]
MTETHTTDLQLYEPHNIAAQMHGHELEAGHGPLFTPVENGLATQAVDGVFLGKAGSRFIDQRVQPIHEAGVNFVVSQTSHGGTYLEASALPGYHVEALHQDEDGNAYWTTSDDQPDGQVMVNYDRGRMDTASIDELTDTGDRGGRAGERFGVIRVTGPDETTDHYAMGAKFSGATDNWYVTGGLVKIQPTEELTKAVEAGTRARTERAAAAALMAAEVKVEAPLDVQALETAAAQWANATESEDTYDHLFREPLSDREFTAQTRARAEALLDRFVAHDLEDLIARGYLEAAPRTRNDRLLDVQRYTFSQEAQAELRLRGVTRRLTVEAELPMDGDTQTAARLSIKMEKPGQPTHRRDSIEVTMTNGEFGTNAWAMIAQNGRTTRGDESDVSDALTDARAVLQYLTSDDNGEEEPRSGRRRA